MFAQKNQTNKIIVTKIFSFTSQFDLLNIRYRFNLPKR